MKPFFVFLVLSLFASVSAQERREQSSLKLREEMAIAVRAKKEPPEAAMAKLRAHASPSGLKIDRDADVALAAIDVGQRLISLGDPEAAEKFFREAEKALDSAIRKTSDAQADGKVMFLRKRAWLRSHFLNKPKDALRDLELALALRPDDSQSLKERQRLATEHGPDFALKKSAQ